MEPTHRTSPPEPARACRRVGLYFVGAHALSPSLRATLNAHPIWQPTEYLYGDFANGRVLDRPEMQRAIHDAHLGRFDLLLIDRITALTRSITELSDVAARFEHAAVQLLCTDHPGLAATATPGCLRLLLTAAFTEAQQSVCAPDESERC